MDRGKRRHRFLDALSIKNYFRDSKLFLMKMVVKFMMG